MPIIGQTELARLLNRDEKAVRQAVQRGRITQRPDGSFDQETAIREFMETTHHEKGHNNRTPRKGPASVVQLTGKLPDIPSVEIPSDTRSTAYAKARAATQVSEALLKRARYEKVIGTLTPTADVKDAYFAEFRILRDACFNIPARIAAVIAGESDVSKCQQMLEAELTNVFQAYNEGKL